MSERDTLQAGRQLQDAEQRYHIFTELSSDFCHICTRSGSDPFRVRWVGGNFERITGYSSDELLAIGCWLPLVHPEDRERVGADLLRMQAGDETRNEFRLIRKDQSVLWIRERTRSLADPDDPTGLVLYGSARDITVARENAQLLQATETAYRTIFNAVNDAIFILDPHNGMIIDCNKQAQQIFSRPRDQLIGVTQVQLTPPDQPGYRQEDACRLAQAAIAGVPQLYEWLCQRPDSSTFWVEVSLRATEINGRSRLLAVVRDITERRTLHAQLQRAQFALEHNADPVYWADAQGRFFYVNQAACRALGYSREQLQQMPVVAVDAGPNPPTDFDQLLEYLRQRNGAVTIESRHRRADGSSFPVEISLNLLEYGGDSYVCGIARDISERYEAARQLEAASRKAEAANRAKNEFLANMSHEVRTPLNGIMGLSQLLRTTALNQEQNEYLDMLDASSRNLLLLINDILDISRIEAGSLHLEETPFSLESLLQEVYGIYEKVADAKGITLQSVIAGRLPQALLGDPLRLKQVLINLIGNAVKFTSHGGVTLTVRCIGEDDREVRLAFVVEDSGIGMSAETLQKVFNPFTQADSSTARIHGGSGLGLAICRRLTELMQGSITVTSSLGHGSRFTVELPFGACSLGAEPEPPATALELLPPGLQILLVEDQEVNRTFVMRLLERQGYRVTPAVDGLMALELLERNRYDLMLLDIQMPGMGGEEVLARLRSAEAENGGHLPVIALTAHALAGDRELLLISGFDGYVAKPVEMDLLQIEMRRVLQERSEQGNKV